MSRSLAFVMLIALAAPETNAGAAGRARQDLPASKHVVFVSYPQRLGLAAAGEGHAGAGLRGHGFKGAGLLRPIDVVGGRNGIACPTGRLLPQLHDAVGVGIAGRLEEHPVDHRKMAALAPSARAMVSTAKKVNPGLLASTLHA